MAEKKFKPGKTLRIVAALMLLGLMVYGTIQLNRPPPPAPLPNPNGYDDFVAAAKLLVGDPLYFDHTNALPLRSQVSSNAEALRLLRQGLTKKCRIPQLAYSTNYIPGRMKELLAAKRLAWLLEAEGKLAELEHRTNDAARICLETIRFGQEACRGGVVIDRLVGLACEGIGAEALKKIVNNLDARLCRACIGELRMTLVQEEHTEEVLRNEQTWSRNNASLRERLQAMIPIESLNPAKRVEKDCVGRSDQFQLQLKWLVIDLATRAYELEHGRHPESLTELVPDYLETIPVDPTTGTNLTYPSQ